ncbi:hypothetical protein [Erythrobacter sp. EC-HK427]|uniref:hypothetical protein n=1 Tax=Erythrobacter sp. EC-HK427 TaxID=2038396 RepID=UPI00125C0B3E|nr:hypothetical protein [Erythrobacter sp. EC-HK427]VVT00754.1 conserved hypothetical protein [Erythrobacter sp. EC-HK427]
MSDDLDSALRKAAWRFSDSRIQALARKVITAMQRMPASGIFGDDYRFKSVWDEYCREVQEGPHPMLEAAFDQTVDPMIAWQVDRLEQSERQLLEMALAEGAKEWGDIAMAVRKSLQGIAIDRDLSKFATY